MTGNFRRAMHRRIARIGIRTRVLSGVLVLVTSLGTALLVSADSSHSTRSVVLPGRQLNGSTLLIDNWAITPAGQQVALATADGTGGNLPLAEALSPDGAYLAILDGGAGTEALQLVDTVSGLVVQTVAFPAPETVFQGLAFSRDGRALYATGGGSNVIHAFTFAKGQLLDRRDASILLPGENAKTKGYPIALTVSADGSTLYVADNLAGDVRVLDSATLTVQGSIKLGGMPHDIALSPDGRTLYVSDWTSSSISVIDPAAMQITATIDVGTHPNTGYVFVDHPGGFAFSPDGARLYVALANADAVAVLDTATNQQTGTIGLAPFAGAPYGASPQSLTVSPDGALLYAADAGDNAVAVIDLRLGSVVGQIPTAWYPTAVALSLDGGRLFVANGKGYGAGPNNQGRYPDPTKPGRAEPGSFSGTMIAGTLSVIPVAGQDLAAWTAQVQRNDRFDAQRAAHPGTQPLPVQQGGISPIKHVIYIIKENRTYDQVFGDIGRLATGTGGDGKANGDPSLTLFPQSVTPNQHALASQFVLFDNFYDDAEVSADGHNWSSGANATDYNERLWPQNYSVPSRNRGYDFEGDGVANLNPGGYLWDSAAANGLSYRDYGEFYSFSDTVTLPEGTKVPMRVQAATEPCAGPSTGKYNDPKVILQPGQVVCFGAQFVDPAIDPNLIGHVSESYRRYDLSFPDTERFRVWNTEFEQFVSNGQLPALTVMRLPQDHTSGLSAGMPSPRAMVADNDAAVGMIVDAVSKSRYWQDTAISVLEDDAQNGPDHVDAHRSTALVISPYTAHKGGFVDHTLYDTASVLRTIELILGLPPMSQYDAGATPMSAAFISRAELSPYTVIQPDASLLAERNLAGTAGAAVSARLDFSTEDRADPETLNRLVWQSVKGSQKPPAPVHNGRRGSRAKGDE